jgi:NAD(P)H-hydrate epimerase
MLSVNFGKVATCRALRIAIDIPSGVNADTGTGDDAFTAHHTLCIHAPKLGSLLHNGKQKSGTLHLIPIGIPCSYDLAENPIIWMDESCHETPMRLPSAHKGMYGRVLVIGGSTGYLGSVAMASRAALRAGAGFVNLLSRKTLEPFYCSNPAEIMFIPIPTNEQNYLPDSAQLLPILNKADSILIGPGLGLDAFAKQLLEIVLQNTSVPTIVDADALRLIAVNAKLRKHLKNRNILLTPHYAEFCALAGAEMPELLNNIPQCLTKFVAKYKAQVLLKGDSTLYQDATRMYLNTSGNDGLATGGSGDVLGGIIASFTAQGMELGKAAINATYLMGKTAEQLAQKRATPSILPTDIIENLFVKGG